MKNIFYILICVLLFSCNTDDLEPTLSQAKDTETSVKTLEDLSALSVGMYNRITNKFYYGRDYIVYGDVRSDNVFANSNSGRFIRPGQFDIIATDAYPTNTWEQMYKTIISASIIINAKDIEGDKAKINDIKGQAHAVRALVHFDLMKIFGQQYTKGDLAVPYVREYKPENLTPTRMKLSEFKVLIENDFQKALTLLGTSDDNQYITTNAVQGLLSRYFIHTAQWEKAKAAADAVIKTGKYSIISAKDFVKSWSTKGSKNSIFELAYNGTDKLGNRSLGQIYMGAAYGDIQPLQNLIDIFEPSDIRVSKDMIKVDFLNKEEKEKGDAGKKRLWQHGKYPTDQGDQNLSILRYEEVVLNYAEALFRTKNADALTWLNKIPAMRGTTPYTAINEDNILLERRKELAFEGFRFDDLMRTGKGIIHVSDQQTFPKAGVPMGDSNLAFPIPQKEINANFNMVQNTGY